MSREVDFLARVRLDPTPRGWRRGTDRTAGDGRGRQDARASSAARRPAGEPVGAVEAGEATDGGLIDEGPTGLVLVEFQTYWRADVPQRAVAYAMRGYDQYQLPVWPVVVVLRPGGRLRSRWDMRFAGRPVLTGRCQLIRLWELPREHVIAQHWVGLYPLLPLMQGPVNDLELLLPQAEALIVAALPPGQARIEAQGALEVFAALLAPPAAIARILQRTQLMIESPMYDYIRDRARAEGRVETLAADIVEVLTVRFGQVPPEIADAVAATADVERLRHLLRLASGADSVELFAQALPEPAPTGGTAPT